jgi:hypothetical protein
MIFVGKSTLYPDVDPWFISTTGFGFPDTYERLPEKPCDAYAWSISIIFSELLWDFPTCWRKRTLMDCPYERMVKGRRTRRYGFPIIHLPHRPRPTLPRTGKTTEAPNPQGRKGRTRVENIMEENNRS